MPIKMDISEIESMSYERLDSPKSKIEIIVTKECESKFESIDMAKMTSIKIEMSPKSFAEAFVKDRAAKLRKQLYT